jgi:hypothetical protein
VRELKCFQVIKLPRGTFRDEKNATTLLRQYQEDEVAPESEGLFEKVADAVNAANDIAHIVRWRR